MQRAALDLRKGELVGFEGRMCTVIYWNILRNDRRQFVLMKLKDLQTGRVTELKEHGDTKFELLDSEEIELTYSYRDGDEEVFFNPNGEEVRCTHTAAEDALLWEADTYKGFYVNGALVAINPPQTAFATIQDTTPPLRGAGSGMKDAVLTNGLKIKVGLLTDVGDKVRVDPVTLEFKERMT